LKNLADTFGHLIDFLKTE